MSDDHDRFFGDPGEKPTKKEKKPAGPRGNPFIDWLNAVPEARRKDVADVIRRMRPKTYQEIPDLLNELLAFTIEGVLTPEMLSTFERMIRLQFDVLTFDRVQQAKLQNGQRSPLFVQVMTGQISAGPVESRQLPGVTVNQAPTLTVDEQISQSALDIYGEPEDSRTLYKVKSLETDEDAENE